MPIFVDRHDMRDMTAESVAAAHRKDLEIQDKYGVKYMTYWFDHEVSWLGAVNDRLSAGIPRRG